MSGRLTSDNESSAQCKLSSTHPTTGAMVEHPNLSVGFIGGGNMATAMARGFLKAHLLSADHVSASARTEATLKKFQDNVDPSVFVTKDNVAVANRADILFLCVKPQFLMAVLEEIRDAIRSTQVLVSVVAGVLLSQIAAVVGDTKICRVMPNTACLIS